MIPKYKVYWLHSPHCHGSYKVDTQPFLDRKTNQVHDHAFVCRHPVVDGKELPHTDQPQQSFLQRIRSLLT